MECIMVDDCGSDKSIEIVERILCNYKGDISFKLLHHKKNQGLSAARNTGIRAASGDYLFFLDSDDTLAPQCIELLSEPLLTERYDLVIGDTCYIDSDGKELPFSMKLRLKDKEVLRGEEIINNYLASWYMMAQNKLYRASFIQDNRLFFKEGLIHEDVLWSYQVACLAQSLYALRTKTYYYLKRDSGITGTERRFGKNDSDITIVKEMGAFLKERDIRAKRPLLLAFAHFSHALYDYVDSYRNYSNIYKILRGWYDFKGMEYIKSIGIDIKWYIRDLHFFLPPSFAPFWHWLFYTVPITFMMRHK